ncbi:MAG: urease accessory protein UreE [Gammaproteobacteria bacterium]|nr:urease accessory protein UreE [Gammaproteobacteria bacterium]
MLRFDHVIEHAHALYGSVTLTYDQRSRARQKIELDSGETAGLFLPRGRVLRPGQKIAADGGEVIEVRAAAEAVSTIYVDDPLLLARACYHLGNRHVALQIETGCVRYQRDHVLDQLAAGLGLAVEHEQAPFEPEAGAYDSTGHSHGHVHHDHEH